MTTGANQGLFVIVSVVIFGIFVLISYIIFQDRLTIGLTETFDTAILQTQENMIPFERSDSKIDKVDLLDGDGINYYKVQYSGATVSQPYHIVGIQYDNLLIPYNHKVIMIYEVRANKNVSLTVDLNGTPKSRPYSYNDQYTEGITGNVSLQPDVWRTVHSSYINNHKDNVNNEELINHTTIGFRADFASEHQAILEVRNIQYKIVPIK